MGPSIKYVMLFLEKFWPPPLSHIVTHPGTPKVCHTSRNPPIFNSTCIRLTERFVLVRGSSCLGVLSGFFVWKVLFGVVFVQPPFCQNTSVTTPSILGFIWIICMKKFEKCDITPPLPSGPPLLVTDCHTFSDPPSSVTYFMDGPHQNLISNNL